MNANEPPIQQAWKVAAASLAGTAVEWYDYFLYGTAAALVFNAHFFPNLDPTTGVLASLASFGVGFVARPLGGFIFGHLGDTVGRKTMLIVTILSMGLGTFIIGLLPTYSSIGIWAPILLVTLRIVQGIAVGGEWGGAALMALEHAPGKRRGFFAAWPQVGVPVGLILSTVVFELVTYTTSEGQFDAWGWRVPFLFSAVLVVIGLVIRLKVSEAPGFQELKSRGATIDKPLVEVLRRHKRSTLLVVGLQASVNIGFYLVVVFALSYGTNQVGVSNSVMLNGLLVAAIVDFVFIFIFGRLSDKFGRRPVYMFGAASFIAWAFPFFLLLNTGNIWLIWLAMIFTLTMGHASSYSVESSMFPELFETRVRYSGSSVGYQLGGTVFSGPTPFVGALLFGVVGATWPISLLLIGGSVLTLGLAVATKETKDIDIDASVANTQPEPVAQPDE